MEDWAAAAGPAGGPGGGGKRKLLRTEIFVPFLVPNIEWIKICKTGGLLGPHREPQCLPPPPESPRRVLASHAGLGSPSGRRATRSCRGGAGRAPHPGPPARPPWSEPSRLHAGSGSAAREGTKQCTGQVSEQQQTARFMQHSRPGAMAGAGRARGPGRGQGPARRARLGRERGCGVSCPPAAAARARCSCGGPRV